MCLQLRFGLYKQNAPPAAIDQLHPIMEAPFPDAVQLFEQDV